ncbi:MAG: T9SS type A sorting domain-containing protein [Chitinophagaceae bacterium]|jgi:hypothetical protein|nr:T9SS type A sorting domain-containing protein [Chitinophagaceae bacterium]
MRRILPFSTLLLSLSAFGQEALYGVTGDQAGLINWTKIRTMGQDGQASGNILLDGAKPAFYFDAQSRRKVTPQLNGVGPDALPGATGIAALAYDKANNRLYFSPLFRDGGIRYIDLASGTQQKVVNVFDDRYNLVDRARDGEGKNITRMVIGRQGIGYAISNDGNSFIRFSTGSDARMENLGTLVDAESNGANSVHNPCTAWGGDLVAAANGDLYLFTMRQMVFRIQPDSRVATYLGNLKGPNDQFTVNGAAVDASGKVILSSSIAAGIKWVIDDMNTLQAREEKDPQWLNASDLASAHLLFAKAASKEVVQPAAITGRVGLYPNPVTQGILTVVFNDMPPGKYDITIMNAAGTSMMGKTVMVQQKGQTETMNTGRLAKGLYVLRITNGGRQEAFAEKVLVQ